MLNPIFKLAKTRDEHLLLVGLLSLPGALTIDEGPADKLIAEHLAMFRALPRSVDSYPEDEIDPEFYGRGRRFVIEEEKRRETADAAILDLTSKFK